MYLGKGIEGFEDRPISPGRMWYTDNPDASIEEFGGEAEAPSETSWSATPAVQARLPWLNVTALGAPVVPEV